MVFHTSAADSSTWAEETFGTAVLGDVRRTQRLVAMAARAAESPRGTVTGVFPTSAEREGAFRFLENAAVSHAAVTEAAMAASAVRCRAEGLVYVAVDGSSLTLSDSAEKRELGRVGPQLFARGLLVMSALAVDVNGAAVGLLDQQWWAREQPPAERRGERMKCRSWNFSERETRFWLEALMNSERRLRDAAPGTSAWYQLDRGADCWPLIRLAVEQNFLVTIRAVHDRRIVRNDGRIAYLNSTMRRQPVLGEYELELPERPGQRARTARMSVRACTVVINSKIGRRRRGAFELNAVLAEEVGRRGGRGLRWLLLTTHPVDTFKDALAVVRGYTMRWRVEEFHRAWKRGLCNVEDTQLRSRNAIVKWATVLAAVAARAVRLAYLIRNSPDLPAASEFTEHEIDAAFILLKRERGRRKKITVGEVIEMVGEIGGFAHKYTGRHAGPSVIGRGLERVQILAMGLKNMSEMR
jgi:Transposase DNA-binding/Transposase DDE domain